jgi:hypothetical protein
MTAKGRFGLFTAIRSLARFYEGVLHAGRQEKWMDGDAAIFAGMTEDGRFRHYERRDT